MNHIALSLNRCNLVGVELTYRVIYVQQFRFAEICEYTYIYTNNKNMRKRAVVIRRYDILMRCGYCCCGHLTSEEKKDHC